ncbi:hypothetical protein ACFPRL_17125 [Pseudoclavibacter helvolus]
MRGLRGLGRPAEKRTLRRAPYSRSRDFSANRRAFTRSGRNLFLNALRRVRPFPPTTRSLPAKSPVTFFIPSSGSDPWRVLAIPGSA